MEASLSGSPAGCPVWVCVWTRLHRVDRDGARHRLGAGKAAVLTCAGGGKRMISAGS